jgi:hypothetical protein
MLKVTGQKIVHRPLADLWQLLMDPQVLRKCIPQCEEFEVVGPGKYRVAIKVGFGLVRGSFRGEAELKDVVEPERYRLEVHAKGTTGFLKGSTEVRLSPIDGGQRTELAYESQVQAGGMLASVGARFLQGAARSFAEEFFDELAKL